MSDVHWQRATRVRFVVVEDGTIREDQEADVDEVAIVDGWVITRKQGQPTMAIPSWRIGLVTLAED